MVGTSFLYILNRDQLQELLNCYIEENRLICDISQNCYMCRRLDEIREILDCAYFFRKRQDSPYQPYCWKNVSFSFHYNINFIVEI